MRTCLVGALQPTLSGMSELADNLMMYDSVGIRCMNGQAAAEMLQSIPLEVLDELVGTKSLFLAVRKSYPSVYQMPASPGTKGPHPVAYEEEFRGVRLATITSEDDKPPFMDAFEAQAKKSLPNSIRHSLISGSRLIELDDRQLVSVTKSDLDNQLLFQKARYAAHRDSQLPPHAQFRSFPRYQEIMAMLNVFTTNWYLAEVGLGYSVGGHYWYRSLVSVKLQGVFQTDRSQVSKAAFQELLNINGLPAIGKMLEDGAITWSSLARLRRQEGRTFRKWFQEAASRPAADAKTVMQEYHNLLAAATRRVPPWRRVSLFVVEQLAGLAHPLAGAAASAFNSFALPALEAGPQPYMLFSALRELHDKSQ